MRPITTATTTTTLSFSSLLFILSCCCCWAYEPQWPSLSPPTSSQIAIGHLARGGANHHSSNFNINLAQSVNNADDAIWPSSSSNQRQRVLFNKNPRQYSGESSGIHMLSRSKRSPPPPPPMPMLPPIPPPMMPMFAPPMMMYYPPPMPPAMPFMQPAATNHAPVAQPPQQPVPVAPEPANAQPQQQPQQLQQQAQQPMDQMERRGYYPMSMSGSGYRPSYKPPPPAYGEESECQYHTLVNGDSEIILRKLFPIRLVGRTIVRHCIQKPNLDDPRYRVLLKGNNKSSFGSVRLQMVQ